MPKREKYDLEFRPQGYWETTNWYDEVLLALVEGVEAGGPDGPCAEPAAGDPVAAEPLAPEADRAVQEAWERIHPAGLELDYLPPSQFEEVEVVRLELASVQCDVVSVRARPLPDGGIGWRIVDEYIDLWGPWRTPFDRSEGPLSFGELLDFLERAVHPDEGFTGLVLGFYEQRFMQHWPDEDFLRFFYVSSPFYPEITEWYEEASVEHFRRLKRRVQRQDRARWRAEQAAGQAGEQEAAAAPARGGGRR